MVRRSLIRRLESLAPAAPKRRALDRSRPRYGEAALPPGITSVARAFLGHGSCGKQATLEGDGRRFERIAQERERKAA